MLFGLNLATDLTRYHTNPVLDCDLLIRAWLYSFLFDLLSIQHLIPLDLVRLTIHSIWIHEPRLTIRCSYSLNMRRDSV